MNSQKKKIFFQVQDLNGDGVSQWQGDADVTGGISSCDCFYIDVTRPTVTSYDDDYVKTGATVTVTGTGFESPHSQPATQDVTVEGNGYSIGGVANNTTLTFDVAGGNYKGYVVVTDAAGNKSTSGPTLYIDNSPPTVGSVDQKSIKKIKTTVITGGGYMGDKHSPIASVKINNATTGIASYNVDSATNITLTATTGNVAYTKITVTDEAGNASTATDIKIAIDNTDPTISGITDTGGNAKALGKSGDVIEIRGNNFVLTGTDASVAKFGGQTAADLGMTVNSVANTKITITLGATEISNQQVSVTDDAGNVGTGGNFTVDNTKPTVDAVATRYIKASATSVVTGSGFKANGDASDVKLGSTSIAGGNASYSIDSDTQITITGAATDFTDQNVSVFDAAGNQSAETGKLLTIDPTRPNITGIQGSAPYIVKSGATVQINGDNNKFTTGSQTSSAEADANILINDTWPTGMTATVAGNAVVITAGAGEVNGVVKIKDQAGNEHTNNGPVVIDNTAPIVNSIGPDSDSDKLVHIKSDGTITILGSGFTNSGIGSSDGSVKLESDNWADTYGTVTVNNDGQITLATVSYTHLTLPTNREV